MEILFPHNKFLHGKILPLDPLPSPQRGKLPLKTSVHFPITITICKPWSKFVICRTSPGDYVRLSRLKDIIIRFFDYAEQNGYLKILSGDFGKKMSVGGGMGTVQFCGSLKKGTRTFSFH